MARVTLKLIITGRVQGVSFRASMREVALRHKVDGWVRNREDGSVVALVQGEEERVALLAEWAMKGPPGAKVASVKRERIESRSRQVGFQILL